MLVFAALVGLASAQRSKEKECPPMAIGAEIGAIECDHSTGQWVSIARTRPAPVIRGVPDHGRPFTMPMDDADSIGSIYKCMDRIHKPHWWSRGKGTGRCVIEPHSIRSGRHTVLARKYPGVLVDVREP